MKKMVLVVIIALIIFIIVGIVAYPYIFNKKTDNSCLKEGETIPGGPMPPSYTPKNCCEGLKAITQAKLVNDKCQTIPDSGYVCANCGNGFCENEENKCNCPLDCDKDSKYSCKTNLDCVSTCSQKCINKEFIKYIINDCQMYRAWNCSCVNNICNTDGKIPDYYIN